MEKEGKQEDNNGGKWREDNVGNGGKKINSKWREDPLLTNSYVLFSGTKDIVRIVRRQNYHTPIKHQTPNPFKPLQAFKHIHSTASTASASFNLSIYEPRTMTIVLLDHSCLRYDSFNLQYIIYLYKQQAVYGIDM